MARGEQDRPDPSLIVEGSRRPRSFSGLEEADLDGEDTGMTVEGREGATETNDFGRAKKQNSSKSGRKVV